MTASAPTPEMLHTKAAVRSYDLDWERVYALDDLRRGLLTEREYESVVMRLRASEVALRWRLLGARYDAALTGYLHAPDSAGLPELAEARSVVVRARGEGGRGEGRGTGAADASSD